MFISDKAAELLTRAPQHSEGLFQIRFCAILSPPEWQEAE